MRQTETVVKEKTEEVEFVYCDECGDECTGEVCYTANEVCKSCADSRKRFFRSVKELHSTFADTWAAETNITVPMHLFLATISPIVYLFTVADRTESTGHSLENSYTTGIILWSVMFGILIGIVAF